jgi:hypothetical protein
MPLAVLLASACNIGVSRHEAAAGNAARDGGAKGILNTVVTAEPARSGNAAAPAAAPETSPAQGSVSATAQPGPGSPQRAAIMDALRPAIERKLAGPVEFVIQRIGVRDGWALVIADPQRPGGGKINPRRHFPNEVIQFMDGLTINAILRFSGGGWTLVDHAIGPTDVWYCDVEGPPKSLTGC